MAVAKDTAETGRSDDACDRAGSWAGADRAGPEAAHSPADAPAGGVPAAAAAAANAEGDHDTPATDLVALTPFRSVWPSANAGVAKADSAGDRAEPPRGMPDDTPGPEPAGTATAPTAETRPDAGVSAAEPLLLTDATLPVRPQESGPAASETPAPAPVAVTGALQKPSRTRRVMRHTVRHTGHAVRLSWIASAGFVIVFLLLVGFGLANRSVALPGWVTAQIQAQLNRGLPAGRITVDRVEVELFRGQIPEVRLKNVGLFDARGGEVARLNEVGAGFELDQLIRGVWLPDRLSLSGAQITVRRRVDGSLDMQFGDDGGNPASSGNLAGLLGGIDRVFSGGPLSRIASITATDLTITLEDARVDRMWQVTGGRLDFTQTASAIDIGVRFEVFNGTDSLAKTSLSFRSDKGGAAAEIGARFENAASGDIALQSPALAFLGVMDAPISGALRMSLGDNADLRDFAGTLEIGKGVLAPSEGMKPIGIDRGKAYFTYDQARHRIDFSDLSVATDAVSVQLSGQTFLTELQPDGWPGAFVGQFHLLGLKAQAEGLLDAPLDLHDGLAEFRLSLKPFDLRLGKLSLLAGASRVDLSGGLKMTPDGPRLALDASLDRIGRDELLALWPPRLLDKTREWLDQNVSTADITGVRAAFRRSPDGPDRLILGARFNAAGIRFMKTMPPIHDASGYVSIDGDRLVVRAEGGVVDAPEGGRIDITGTVYTIPDIKRKPAPAVVDLKATGPIPAVLSMLDQDPFRVMQKARRPVDLAQGVVDATARIDLILKPKLQPDEVRYSVAGTLRDVRSDRIVPGRKLAADKLSVTADGKTLTIAGPASFGAVPVDFVWTQGIGPDPAPGKLDGTVELGKPFLKEFGIGLPSDAVAGKGRGTIAIGMGAPGSVPTFRLTSDLVGLGLKLDSIVWNKPAATKGRLEVSGTLGAPPRIDSIVLEGSGLSAKGAILLNRDGSLDQARFDRVRLGGWLDAPVTLTGRGAGAQPGVVVRGGTLDLRQADFGADVGGAAGGPVTVQLDRLTVADGIELTSLQGKFSTKGGFSGQFSARLNGGGVVNGTVTPQNGGTALRVVSENAGDVLRDAKVAQRIRGGAMELILLPSGRTGTYNGSLKAANVRVRGTPALAELLNAVSIVGLLQQLNGDGLVFDQVESRFVLTPNAITFTQGSAVGASMGISATGTYALGSGAIDIRGVFSPIYLVNGIGQIFGRKGEGLFGFNYRVQGTSESPKVSVNPLSILTPGMFREIFRAPPPKIQ